MNVERHVSTTEDIRYAKKIDGTSPWVVLPATVPRILALHPR